MKKFKKLTVVVLTLAVICTLIVAFAACGKKISEISIGQQPRLTYVLGQELDLSSGKLTVVADGKTEEIDLTDPDVKISGYNKDTLGKQSVTIEYKGFETTIEVTVVQQIAAERHTQEYFVGESLNTQVGRLKITRNDGTDFTVDLSDEKVTLTGFDSSTAGDKTVQVKYEDYTGSFTVKVVEATKATLRSPNKNAYLSHEEGIDLAGGYLTLENADGSLKKTVPLTESMVSGADLSKATIENLVGNPLKQTVTVNYVGTHTFDIYITFSGVSLMKLRAEELSKLDWSTSMPAITDAQGAAAVEAMQSYFDLSSIEQGMISEEEKNSVVRVAAVHAKNVWEKELTEFSNTFIITRQNGTPEAQFQACTYEQAQETYAKLSQSNTPVRAMEELLSKISTDFSNTILVGEEKMADYLQEVYNATIFDYVLTGIEYAQDLYDLLIPVPAEWSAENIKPETVKEALDDSLDFIATNKFKGSNYGDFSLYDMISAWRGVSEENDLMDMYYQHCFANKNVTGLNVIKSIYLPTDIAAIYGYITACDYYLYQLSNMQAFDTSPFMWMYNCYILETQNKLQTNEDELIRWAYENINYGVGVTFDAMVDELKVSYVDYCGGMYGNKTFEDLWNRFFEIMKRDSEYDPTDPKWKDEPQFSAEQVEGFLQALIEAPASVQLGFLSSMSPTYTDPKYALSVLDYTVLLNDPEKQVSALTAVLTYYFDSTNGVLPEDGEESKPRQLFRYLLSACEDYIRRYESVQEGTGYFTSFRIMMLGAKQEYEKLSPEHKSAFDGKVGYLYETLMGIAGLYDDKFFDLSGTTAQKDPQLGEWNKKFDELAVLTYEIDGLVQTNSTYVGLLFSMYVKAEALAAEIINAGGTVAEAYYHYDYSLIALDGENEVVLMKMTLDHAMYLSRISFIDYLANLTGTADEYFAATEKEDSELKAFMMKAYDAYMLALEDDGYEYTAQDGALIADMFSAFRALSLEERSLFCRMDVAFSYSYMNLLTVYFRRTLGTTVDGAFVENERVVQYAIDLLGLEQSYTLYAMDTENEDALAQVKKALAVVEESKKALETGDSVPEYLHEMYNSYTELCNGLPN